MDSDPGSENNEVRSNGELIQVCNTLKLPGGLGIGLNERGLDGPVQDGPLMNIVTIKKKGINI